VLLSGAASNTIEHVIGGATLLTIGMIALLAAGWIDSVALLIAVLPLPALYSSELVRVAPAMLLTPVVLLAWFIARGADRRPMIVAQLPWRAVTALFAALCLAGAFATSRGPALRELANWVLFIGLLALFAAELQTDSQRTHRVARKLGLLGAICGAAALLQSVGILPASFTPPGSGFYRATLGFGWPNEAGMFMALLVPFAVYASAIAESRAARLQANFGLGLTILGLAATFSRGSWLATLTGSLFLLFARQKRFVLRIWLTALAAAFVINVLSGGAITERILGTIGDWVVEQRAALTLAGVLMFIANPIVGVGPGGFASSLEDYGPGISWLWDYLPTAQNGYVQMAAEAGVIGLVALLVFYGASLRQPLLRLRSEAGLAPNEAALQRSLLWALAIVCMLGMVEWTFAHGIAQLLLLIVAMSFTKPAPTPRAAA
jgi:O-antigen ligase